MRFWRVLLIGVCCMILLGGVFAARPAALHAQTGDLQVWVIPLNEEYADWQIEYRDSNDTVLATFVLPYGPFNLDHQSGGRVIGSNMESITLFDPYMGDVRHYVPPNLLTSTNDTFSGLTGVALASDGRIAYNLTYQVVDESVPSKSWIYVTQPGGGGEQIVSEHETQMMYVIEPHLWRSDGGAIMLHEMPMGIGGYILFWTYREVQILEPATGQLTYVASNVDGISDDFSLYATLAFDANYNYTGITVTDMATRTSTTYPLPALAEIPETGGGAYFSPDNSKIAYQVARRNPEQEKYWTIVVDLVTGQSRVVLEDEGRGFELAYGNIAGWMDNNTLAVGNFWHKNANTAIVDVTAGRPTIERRGVFLGYARGITDTFGFAEPSETSTVCAGAPESRLRNGARGRVTFTDGSLTNVRDSPSLDGRTTFQIAEGATFTAYQGPICADGYAWWQLAFDDGSMGWVAEGTPDSYFLEPWQ